MLRNRVRRIMYGAILVVLGLMSLKKVRESITSGSIAEEFEEVHASLG